MLPKEAVGKETIFNLGRRGGWTEERRIWFTHQTLTQDVFDSREEQSPNVIKVKSTHFPYGPHHLRKSSKGSLVLYQFNLQINLVCVWNCLGLLLLHYFLCASLLQTYFLFYLTKEVHDLTLGELPLLQQPWLWAIRSLRWTIKIGVSCR